VNNVICITPPLKNESKKHQWTIELTMYMALVTIEVFDGGTRGLWIFS
jgi:hypothetical protein